MAKISLTTARRNKKSKFDNSSTHITTLDVGQLRPTNVLLCNASDSFDIDYAQFSRLSPLVAPTFGSFRLKTFAFFVPHRIVWKGYEGFVSRSADPSVHRNPLTLSLRWVVDVLFGISYDSSDGGVFVPSSSTMYAILKKHEQPVSRPVNMAGYDFCFVSPAGAYYFNLTTRGRWVYNVFVSLGYELPHYLDATLSGGFKYYSDKEYDLLPLLSFARCLYDYVYPSQYVQQMGFAQWFDIDDSTDVDYSLFLSDLFDLMFVPYDQDFFTSLWHSPNSVAVGSGASAISAIASEPSNQNSLYSSIVDTELYSRVRSDPDGSQYTLLSASGLRWIQALSDFVMRNNIGGTRFSEWLRAHTGFVTKNQRVNESVFLKSWSDDIQISDVTAYTGTSTQVLGEQAGKAVASSQGHLKFQAQEAGYLIFLTMVVPRIGYYQGDKPWVHPLVSPFDFYTPELDSVGLEPVPFSDLYASYDTARAPIVPFSKHNDVFGFAPRYAHKYKHGFDYLSGDFRLGSRNRNLSPYHTFRDLESDDPAQGLALNAEFMSVGNQYNRIFAVDPTDEDGSSSKYDKIFSIFRYSVTRHSYMSSISESLPLFDKSGDETEVNYQGTQLN